MQPDTQIAGFGRLVGDSAKMRTVYEMMTTSAATLMPVLIVGETGTGKELVAREVHDRSERGDGPFVAVNTGLISPELVASELFGQRKGASTGAIENKEGRLKEAHRGTLFLDEIGTMADEIQVALLRVLEHGIFRPVGGQSDLASDARLIAATNEDIDAAVKRGQFRGDLLYRLKVLTIRLPPLRDRLEDLAMLCGVFIESVNTEFQFEITDISDDALAALREHHWPGNVRELKNVIAHAAVSVEGGLIERWHLPQRFANNGLAKAAGGITMKQHLTAKREENQTVYSDNPQPSQHREREPLPARDAGDSDDALVVSIGATLDEVQREYTLRTLAYCDNNKTKAAEMLGVSRKTLYQRLAKWSDD